MLTKKQCHSHDSVNSETHCHTLTLCQLCVSFVSSNGKHAVVAKLKRRVTYVCTHVSHTSYTRLTHVSHTSAHTSHSRLSSNPSASSYTPGGHAPSITRSTQTQKAKGFASFSPIHSKPSHLSAISSSLNVVSSEYRLSGMSL